MDPVQLYTILGVLAVLLGVIAYGNVRAALAARRVRALAPGTGWVGRHVQFGGDVVGEVVAEERGLLILRKGPDTLAVPRDQVRPHGLDLGLRSFDPAAAAAEGAAWKSRTEAP